MLGPRNSGWCLQFAGPGTVRFNNLDEKPPNLIIKIFLVRTTLRMFRSKRKDSAIRTLVAETLVLAKTHGYVEKIEHELEEELQRENTEPPNRILAKWRRNGEKMLKNKYTLLTVALFCVTECALILGELILDLHKVKVVLETQETEARVFVERLCELYPHYVDPGEKISIIYESILRSKISWQDSSDENNETHTLQAGIDGTSRHKRYTPSEQTVFIVSSGHKDSGSMQRNATSGRPPGSVGAYSSPGPAHAHNLEEDIAHVFHMASITILSLLVFQTILKALFAGTAFFRRKLETFDLCIVLISFIVDLVCMQIMPRYKIQDFVFILAFLLPWRVIRVVNSLVVAVQDHEHFRLKLIYGRKKKIVNSLRESEIKLQLFRTQCNALKRLCFNEGIDESKIDQILMVEECVVNKAGKSKCKIKVDNSSVILLNDKSDFPRLSPRPSLLNLVDKIGIRRKSMQPPGVPSSGERDIFLNTKDSPKKWILKSRARSNSESGFGTLSSPDEAPVHQNSFGDGYAFSGLSTPIIINRKNSLNSPIMVNYVRNILNSLEDKINQMNSGCSRLGGGRGSIDADSIAEETEDLSIRKQTGRRVHSIEEKTEGIVENDSSGVSYISKRRASLQPQKCVDEDDLDVVGAGTLTSTPAGLFMPSDFNQSTISVSTGSPDVNPSVSGHKFIHTTIQIDPPSVQSNYSSSSTLSSNSNGSIHDFSLQQPLLVDPLTSGTSALEHNTPQAIQQQQVALDSPWETPSCFGTQTLTLESFDSDEAVQRRDLPDTHLEEIMPSSVSAAMKPKTLRTPSDIENQNSLIYVESVDICESENCGVSDRTMSVMEQEDQFGNAYNTMSITSLDEALTSATNGLLDLDQALVNPDVSFYTDDPQAFSLVTVCNGNICPGLESSRNSLNPKESVVYPSPSGSSVDPPEYISNGNSVLHFIG